MTCLGSTSGTFWWWAACDGAHVCATSCLCHQHQCGSGSLESFHRIPPSDEEYTKNLDVVNGPLSLEICIWVSLQGSDHAVALTAHGRVFTWGQPFSRICLHIKPLNHKKSSHILDERLEACTSLGLSSGPLHDHFSITAILYAFCVCVCYSVFAPWSVPIFLR